MIIKSEDFYENTVWHMENVSRFLGLRPFDWTTVVGKKYNFGEKNAVFESEAESSGHPDLPLELRLQLDDFFVPFNERLQEVTGITWDT